MTKPLLLDSGPLGKIAHPRPNPEEDRLRHDLGRGAGSESPLLSPQAPCIRGRTWHPSQRVETEPDGSTVLMLNVADLSEVKRWLIAFGFGAELLARDELCDDIDEEASQVTTKERKEDLT